MHLDPKTLQNLGLALSMLGALILWVVSLLLLLEVTKQLLDTLHYIMEIAQIT